jgi:hypothetical protein
MSTMMVRPALLAAALLAGAVPAQAQSALELRTGSEESRFTRHTSYDEMVSYMEAVQARSTEMKLSSFARTRLGREVPFAIFSRPGVTRPEEALLTGKPIVLLAANVHGGERTFRESVLIMLRDLATPGTELNAMLDHMIILVAPSLNPDGFEATPGGTRGNAWGIDMNRDYIKLGHPEIAGYVGNLVNRWFPHLYIDGHNGGSYPYSVTYQCASNAAADQRITELCDKEIFPFVDRELEADGFKSFYYDTGTSPTRWTTGGSDARIGRNYGGMANSVAILYESPGGQGLEKGVQSGVIAYRAALRFVRDNPERLLTVVNRARQETILMGERAEGQIPVRMRYEPEDWPVTYLYAEGRAIDAEIRTIRSDSLMKKPVATLLRPRPFAYVLPREATEAVAMLRRHNITVEQLHAPLTVEVQAYTLTGITYESAYNHSAATRVETGEVVTVTRTFPAGAFVVRTGQVLGRIVTHMLEPETTDNVIYWNTMDAWLPKAALRTGGGGAAANREPPLIPIFKVMRPTAFPARIIE